MKIAVLSSIVVDIVIQVDRLPKLQEDVNTKSLDVTLGGMGLNVFWVAHCLGCEIVLGSPVGSGIFGDLAKNLLEERGIEPIAKIEDIDNGCCLCIVNDDGERSFISHHGAEYMFEKEWFKNDALNDVELIYASGIDLEEMCSASRVQFITNSNKKLFFAPGPRLLKIDCTLLKKMCHYASWIHLNEIEAYELSGCKDIVQACEHLSHRYNADIIVTLSERGAAYYSSGKFETIPGKKVEVVDTIGAGDAHAGAILAGISKNMSLADCIELANEVASKVVRVKGANLKREEFEVLEVF